MMMMMIIIMMPSGGDLWKQKLGVTNHGSLGSVQCTVYYTHADSVLVICTFLM